MLSTLNAKESDPHDVFVIDPEVVLAARGDRAPAPVRQEANLAPAAQAYAAADIPEPSLDTTFRVTASDHIQLPREPSPIGKWVKRASMAFLFALLSAFAAAAWKHHGDTARQMVATWIPQLSLIAPSSDTAPVAEPSAQAATEQATQAAAIDQAATQPAAPAQTADGTGQAAAATPQDSTQLLQSMARDLASMGQQIEQLKASIDQLKAGQEQMAREIARNAEPRVAAQTAQPRIAQPRPAAMPVRRPKPALPPVQSAAAAPPSPAPAALPAPAAAAPAPTQYAPQPQGAVGDPVVRPPMPVR